VHQERERQSKVAAVILSGVRIAAAADGEAGVADAVARDAADVLRWAEIEDASR
jgi:hypothetical protein